MADHAACVSGYIMVVHIENTTRDHLVQRVPEGVFRSPLWVLDKGFSFIMIETISGKRVTASPI